MKYLRTYNESITDYIINDVQDICLELTDQGIGVNIFLISGPSKENNYMTQYYISIFNESFFFNWDQVKDCILRLKDYLGDKYRFTIVGSEVVKDIDNFSKEGIDNILIKYALKII